LFDIQSVLTGTIMKADDKSLARQIAGTVGRNHLTAGMPATEGGSYFFEVRPGWETRVLRSDSKVTTVLSVRHLEEAFVDPTVLTIFIPADSAITRALARRVCRRHGRGKTVFFEISGSEL
jgi:hypothetical protein